MIFTKANEYENIISQLDKNDFITIISCSSCARIAGTGGEKPMKQLALRLRKDGYQVVDGYTINTVCTPKVFQAKIGKKVNTLISLTCSAGTCNLEKLFEGYKVVEATRDIGLMSADNKKKTVRVEVPYEGYEHIKGQEYEMFTGQEIENNKVIEEDAK